MPTTPPTPIEFNSRLHCAFSPNGQIPIFSSMFTRKRFCHLFSLFGYLQALPNHMWQGDMHKLDLLFQNVALPGTYTVLGGNVALRDQAS
eukprot:3110058-Amphidinium_carterae.1